jgi:hypothetical protein
MSHYVKLGDERSYAWIVATIYCVPSRLIARFML